MSRAHSGFARAARKPAGKRATAETALLIVDMINTLHFQDGGRLLQFGLPAARCIARLRNRLGETPVVYVNDNFMHWQADFREIVALCSQPGSRGAPIARLLAPRPGDYFVLKPKHSGFFSTPLELLLAKLHVTKIVLVGMAADGCVLATAADAHMRELSLRVPADCVASPTRARTRRALALMKSALGADIRSARDIR